MIIREDVENKVDFYTIKQDEEFIHTIKGLEHLRWEATLEYDPMFDNWDAWDRNEILFHEIKGTKEQAIQEVLNQISLKKLTS